MATGLELGGTFVYRKRMLETIVPSVSRMCAEAEQQKQLGRKAALSQSMPRGDDVAVSPVPFCARGAGPRRVAGGATPCVTLKRSRINASRH